MTHQEMIVSMIKEHAGKIRAEIDGALLFGQPIDMDDVDSLIVAAYGAGEGWVRRRNEKDRMISL